MAVILLRSPMTAVALTLCAGAWLTSGCGGDKEDGEETSGGSAGSSAGEMTEAMTAGAAGKASGGSSGSGSGGSSKGGSASSAGTSGSGGSSSGNAGSSSSGDCSTKTPVASCSEDGTDPDVETSACIELYTAGFAELICGPREIKDEGCPRTDQLRYICVGANNSDFWYSDDSKPDYWSNNKGGCEINGGSWCAL